jgi:hypothetical protein
VDRALPDGLFTPREIARLRTLRASLAARRAAGAGLDDLLADSGLSDGANSRRLHRPAD